MGRRGSKRVSDFEDRSCTLHLHIHHQDDPIDKLKESVIVGLGIDAGNVSAALEHPLQPQLRLFTPIELLQGVDERNRIDPASDILQLADRAPIRVSPKQGGCTGRQPVSVLFLRSPYPDEQGVVHDIVPSEHVYVLGEVID